ncbi:MAG: arginine--tRNA ligase [Synergistetes bacterium]|nr:arginine--tRNA ligase [Synergistota bacterium]
MRGKIVQRLQDVLKGFKKDGLLDEIPEVKLEKPSNIQFGEWSSAIAFHVAKRVRKRPIEVAREIASRLRLDDLPVEAVDVAGGGFLNFRMKKEWSYNVLKTIIVQGKGYGSSNVGNGKRVQVEFVSANPTGPLHVGHGRGAAVGDTLAAILKKAGYDVEKEYYINDAGNQMKNLGASVRARYMTLCGIDTELPEQGYRGKYIWDIASEIREKEGDRFVSMDEDESLEFFTMYAKDKILKGIKDDLGEFGVRFDVWFSEKDLYDSGEVEDSLRFLEKRGYIYEKGGAKWFRSTAFGDNKDRVVIKSDGTTTYLASDIAYHRNKYMRGFQWLIDIWGADHHGYVPRMKGVIEALGFDPKSFDVLLIQFVNLLRDGKQISMSTRAGEFITLREVIDEVGRDVARFFFITRKSDSHLDFDLELAKKASLDNPVYYVQYAYARTVNIFRQAELRGIEFPNLESVDLSLLDSDVERLLIKKLSAYPEEIEIAAREMAPHRMFFYVQDLASSFHHFYNHYRVLGEEPGKRDARMVLVKAVQYVVGSVLDIMGVSAPERM